MSSHAMPPVYIDFLNRFDVEELHLTNEEIIGAIENQLRVQGEGQTVIEPRVFLEPGVARGHFNVLRGAIGGDIGRAGVKVVGDFVDNYQLGYPSELATLLLLDPHMGAPKAIIEASGITDMRTGAVTAVGAKYLARKGSKVLGHIGARGSSYWNVRLLDSLFDFDEIRVHSRRPESQNAFAERLSNDLGKPVRAMTDWQSTLEGADIVVEASRLVAPEPLLKTEWIKPGALVMPYGTQSAVELSLTDVMSKLIVDDWGQCKGGKWGALRQHVEAGKLSEATLHAEMGQIVAGQKPGRENDQERILFWHRGLSLSDIALGHAMLEKARAMGVGQRLRFC
jgi:ornithine cyclodeaminase